MIPIPILIPSDIDFDSDSDFSDINYDLKSIMKSADQWFGLS